MLHITKMHIKIRPTQEDEFKERGGERKRTEYTVNIKRVGRETGPPFHDDDTWVGKITGTGILGL